MGEEKDVGEEGVEVAKEEEEEAKQDVGKGEAKEGGVVGEGEEEAWRKLGKREEEEEREG